MLLLGPIPEVSLLKAEKYAHNLIAELYPAFHNVQLAFADGSTGGALCFPMHGGSVWNNSFLFYYLLISIFCSHCMSSNTSLSSKWCYFSSPGNTSYTCRNRKKKWSACPWQKYLLKPLMVFLPQLYPRNVPAVTIPSHCSDGLTHDRQAVLLLPMKWFSPDVCPSVPFLNITWENHPNHCQ